MASAAELEIQASLIHVAPDHDAVDPFATLAIGESTSTGTRFRILRPHAKGGLGEVFVAEDRELGREVALKQIQPRHADESDSRARFVLEAEITGGLEHPGIVPVYGLGAYADGRPYYAMRFIRGDSLKDAIERFHSAAAAKLGHGEWMLELRKLLGRFIDVCNAIEYAHSRGVLHRDLKPGNIMLGKFGETLVVDWGLAKPLGRSDVETVALGERPLAPSLNGSSAPTQMGSAVGTPQYMSPEQAAGRLDLIGPQSDVYSLGATLYCLLTGQAPLADRPPGDLGELLRCVERGEITPPRQVKAKNSSVQPEIPKPLEAICLKAMALKPADRYTSGRALADDLEHWLADEPIAAQSDTSSERIARWTRRHRALAQSGAAALALVAVIALIAVALVEGQRKIAHHERLIAQRLAEEKAGVADQESLARRHADALAIAARQSRERADQQTQLAMKTLNSVVFEIQTKLDGVPGAGKIRRELLDTAIDGLEQVARTLDTAPQADRALVASHSDLGESFLVLGGGKGSATAEALRQFEIAEELAAKLAEADRANVQAQRDLSISYERLGDVHQQLGNASAARDAYRHALEISQKLAQGTPANAEYQRDLSVSYNKLGNIDLQLGDFAAAREAFQQGLKVREQLAEAEPLNAAAQRDLSVSYTKLGVVHLQLHELPAARDAIGQGLTIREKLAAADPQNIQAQRDLSVSYDNLGAIDLQIGDTTAARDADQRALAISRKLVQADPQNIQAQRDLSISFNKVGDVELQLGNSTAAHEAYQQGWEISRKLADGDPKNAAAQRDLSISYNKLGDVNQHSGNLAAARDAYRQGLEISRKLALADPTNLEAQGDLVTSLGCLGAVETKADDFPTAVKWFQQGIDVLEPLVHNGKVSGQPLYQNWLNDLRKQLQTAAAKIAPSNDEQKP